MNLTKGIHYNLQMEAAILGACLLEKTAFSRVFGVLKPEIFYSENHQKVFEVMAEMFDKNLPIDMITVWDFLQRVKGISEMNGNNTAYYVSTLTNGVVSSAHMEYHSLVLQSMWCQRELIKLTTSGTRPDASIQQQAKEIQDKLFQLQTTSTSDGWKSMDEGIIDLYKHQDEMEATKGMGITTGFKTIDKIYGGFFNGQMIVIGARPSMGKSAFAGQIAMNVAAHGKKVGIVSLEMNNNEIMARMAAIDANLDFNSIYRSMFKDEEQKELFYKRLNSSLSKLPIWVSDKTRVNISAIKAQALKLKHNHGLDFLIIDYLQLISGDITSNKSRENIVAEISRGFKLLVKELNIPGMILCQLNRDVESRKGQDRFPKLSDLRESGAIEQDADAVMFLHSDFMSGNLTNKEGVSTEGQAHLVVRKWRNGMSNLIIDLEFDGAKMKFKEKSGYYVKTFTPIVDDSEETPF